MKLLLFLETRARVLVDRTQTVASRPTKEGVRFLWKERAGTRSVTDVEFVC